MIDSDRDIETVRDVVNVTHDPRKGLASLSLDRLTARLATAEKALQALDEETPDE